jgi:hypothetical protein
MTSARPQIRAAITANYADLSETLRTAADYLADNQLEIATRSLRAIAAASGVSPASYTRLARAIGFTDYEALREQARSFPGSPSEPAASPVSTTPPGGAICRLVNKGRKDHGIRCSVESTGGSVYNLNTIPPASWTWVSPSLTGSITPTTAPASSPTKAPTSACAPCSPSTPSRSPLSPASRFRHQKVRRPQGQARQHRQPGLRSARHHGSRDGRHGLDQG